MLFLDDAPGPNLLSPKHEGTGNSMKLGKVSDVQRKSRCNIDERELNKTCKSSHIMIRSAPIDSALEGEATLKNDDIMVHKQSVETCFDSLNKNDEVSDLPYASNLPNNPKPLLKLKLKTPYFDQDSSWVPEGVEDKNCVKGQRSKRKRSSMEKINICEDDHNVNMNMENSANEVEAKALQKLDKGAIGKRVEGQSSVGSW